MIQFDHAVKYGGKYYPAGAEIPEPAEAEAEATAEEQPEAPEKATKRRKKGDA